MSGHQHNMPASGHQQSSASMRLVEKSQQVGATSGTTTAASSVSTTATTPTANLASSNVLLPGSGSIPSSSTSSLSAHHLMQSSSSSSQSTHSSGGHANFQNNNNRPSPETVSFHLKSSIFTRLVTIDSDKMALGLVKQLAIAFLNEIYFQHSYPSNTYIGDYLKKHYSTNDNLSSLYDRIIMRIYNPSQDSFVPFNSVGDIQSDSYVSIEISERKPTASQQQQLQHHHHHHYHHQHLLSSAAATATATASSSSSVAGSGSSQCSNCTGFTNTTAATTTCSLLHQAQLNNSTNNNCNSNSGANLLAAHPLSCSISQYQLKISHDFHTTTYIKPTYCASCSALIIGVYKQGFQCSYCKKNYCPKCKIKAEASGEGCLALAPAPPLTPTLGPAPPLPPPPSATTIAAATNASTTAATAAASPTSTTSANLIPSPRLQQQQLQYQMGAENSATTSSNSPSSANSNKNNNHNSSSNNNNNGTHHNNGNQHQNNANNSEKLDISHANMSKRKSASNLLHFNIANPFKSHHASSTTQASSSTAASQAAGHQSHQSKDEMSGQPPNARPTTSKSMRSSVGALDIILQQLSRQKDQQQPQQQQQNKLVAAAAVEQQQQQSKSQASQVANQKQQQQQPRTQTEQVAGEPKPISSSKLLNVAPAQQLSSSHQNLYTISDREHDLTSFDGGAPPSGCSSAHQSPSKGAHHQLSNSARNSARDVSHGTSPTRRDMVSNHAFISMDWIQIYGEPNCGVCSKPLKGPTSSASSRQQQPAAMCKTCKLQVHAQCQDLALADCLSRITESSRAAGRQRSGSPDNNNNPLGQQDSPMATGSSTAVKSTNSNVSRDNIRLHRLAPSVKHIKRPDLTKPIIEGWLQHKTLSDEQPRRHYWRLDETDITLYESDTSPRYFKAIALNKITRVISASSLPKQIKEDAVLNANKSPERQQTRSAHTSPTKTSEFRAQMESMFAFEVTTGSVYLVQATDQSEANRWRGSLQTITEKMASGETITGSESDQQQQQHQSQAAKQEEDPTAGKSHAGATSGEPGHQSKLPSKDQENVSPEKVATSGQEDSFAESLNKQQLASVAEDDTNSNSNKRPAVSPAPDTKPKGRHHHHHHHHHQHHHQHGSPMGAPLRSAGSGGQQHKTYTDPKRSRLYNRPRIIIKLDPMSIPDHWIEGKYLIERNRTKGSGFEELGSGQFGKVYAAISEIKAEDPTKGLWSGVPVAIKEISKARFDLKQQAKLKNEANILSRLDHPGVIILERVHDLPDKLYIVMEQLEDDMLEMIVSTEEKRLSERVTKFLTYQILEALKYLHSQNIAHCDLKPENVLLCERRSQFPQIKLCDFGFAKIIEENSFRSSLVGTPAYLAPEVVKGERYNRSVDLWSVGVIIYVSLSGEFPFNEGENIHDQISRANFMYPDQPWAKVSQQAKAFITSLLRVNSDKRLSASRAQMDPWIQDYQLWCDLCELELRVGRRWVTDDADFSRWSQYAKQHLIQVPRAAVQLHQELSNE